MRRKALFVLTIISFTLLLLSLLIVDYSDPKLYQILNVLLFVILTTTGLLQVRALKNK